MEQAETASSTFASAENAAAIAAKNHHARLSIGREIEELLRIRREADATATRLIDLLDLEALDPDLEAGGDEEPTLGWTASEAAYGRTRNSYANDGEFEPSLGWTSTIDQTSRNRLGHTHDVEEEHDGREPSLGSLERIGQEGWAAGDRRDLEEQCEDEGACATAVAL